MIHLFRQYFSIRKAIFILGEGALIFCAVSLASLALLADDDDALFGILFEVNWTKILLVTVVTQISLYFNDLYEMRPGASKVELAMRLIQSIGIASITLAGVYYIYPDAMIGRWIFFISIVFLVWFIKRAAHQVIHVHLIMSVQAATINLSCFAEVMGNT